MVILVIALILGTAVAAVGMWAMLLLFAASPLATWIDRKRVSPRS